MTRMTNKEIEGKYTPEEIEAIYRYQKMKYAIEDANCHIDDFVDWHEMSVEEEEKLRSYAEEMAERYLYKFKDCSLPENSVWEHLVEIYYDEKVKGE